MPGSSIWPFQDQSAGSPKNTLHARGTNTAARAQRLTNPARPSALVGSLFEACVASAELRETADSKLLYPAEAALCSGFAAKRLADFTAGRLCARYALAELDVDAFPLLVRCDRSPRWPPGIQGSISHTEGFVCAVAARTPDVAGIGVDAEIVGRVTSDLDALIFTARESAFLESLNAAERARAATIIFSAKEAFYKCQHALTDAWLDFKEASLELTTDDLLSGTFAVGADYERLRLLGKRIELPLHGRFLIVGDLAVTGLALYETRPRKTD